MKKMHLLMLLLPFIGGCDKNRDYPIWDFAVYDICIIVENVEGENLLDTQVAGNIRDNEIKVEYNGETYLMNENHHIDAKYPTRANKPHWQGLRSGTYHNEDTIMLMFGEFSQDGDHKGETFTVNWGDGTSNKVKFDMYITWKKGKPVEHNKIWLDGVLRSTDSFMLKITK